MILSVIVLCCWMYSVSAVNISISAQEVTTTSAYFPGTVRSMIPHPSNSRVLVITSPYSVWTLELENLDKTLIAGSSGTTSGYNEGFGSAARFNSLRGSAEFNQTTVLVADNFNECLRTVSLISGSTQRYAGVCGSSGSNDGYRTSSKFYSAWGMAKNGSTFYISDLHKIRKLDGNIVSTLVSLSYSPYGLSWNGEKFLYSFRHGVGDSQNSVITGSSSSGFLDGSLNSARFYGPYAVLAVTTRVFLVADLVNRAVRLGDLCKQTVSTLNITYSRWTHSPNSLMILNGSVYVGAYGRIFKFPLDEIPDVSYFECPHDQNLILPADACYANVTFQQPRTSCDRSHLRCVECPSSAQLNEGVHEIKFTYRNLITDRNLTCNYSIHVLKDANLPNQDYIECPDDVNVTLPFNTDYVNTTLSKPHTTVDRSHLRCVECPSSVQVNEGEHEIKFTYRNLITENNLTCNYRIYVVKQTTPTCENITERIYLPADQKVSNKVSAGDISIALPPGVYYFELSEFCHHNYIIHEWSNMERQSEFQARYPYSCSTLPTSLWIINVTLLTHQAYLRHGCPECNVTNDSPDVKCLNDNLIITWKTNNIGSQRDRSAMESNLRAAITEFQSRNARLFITVFTAGVPSIVHPITDESGLDLKVMTKTSCLDEGLVYDQQSDGCVRAPCAH